MTAATVSFESKFSQLADVHLAERVPSLNPYKIGFQIIDKTEDDTRAVGISAYIMDDLWMYIPVFFIEGKLKGSELLYLKQRDTFVPAMDNWIAVLKNQGLAPIGRAADPNEDSDKSDGELRTRPEDITTYQPYLGSWSGDKQASLDTDPNTFIDQKTWDKMARALEQVTEWNRPSLTDLPQLSKQASRTFVDIFLSEPEFANTLFKFYDVEAVEKLAKECVEVSAVVEEVKPSDVEIFTEMNEKAASELSDSEKNLMQRQGIYVKDNRNNFSKVFQEEVKTGVLKNPTDPGIYDVLMADGEYKTFIIIFPECLDQEPTSEVSHNGPAPTKLVRKVALINPEEPSEFVEKPCDKIFCQITQDPRSVFRKPSNDMGREATFEALNSLKDKYVKIMFVQGPKRAFSGYISKEAEAGAGSIFRIRVPQNSFGFPIDHDEQECPVYFTGEDGKLDFRHGRLYVPKGCRIFLERNMWDCYDCAAPIPEEEETEKKPRMAYAFGTPSDIWRALQKHAGMRHIAVHSQGGLFQLRFNQDVSGLMDKRACVEQLTLGHGIEAGQAVGMIKAASRGKDKRAGYFIKHAAPYDVAAYGTSAAPYQGGPAGKQEVAVQTSVATSRGQKQDNAQARQGIVDTATSAANAGIKEVFDAEVLKALLDKADISETRKDYIGRMMSGMDAAGRMLFLLYWHMDAFEDRFGNDQMDELESNLRETFIQTGDLILFLQEKNENDGEESENLFGMMSEDIGASM